MDLTLRRITSEDVKTSIDNECPKCGQDLISKGEDTTLEAVTMERWQYGCTADAHGPVDLIFATDAASVGELVAVKCFECGHLLASAHPAWTCDGDCCKEKNQ